MYEQWDTEAHDVKLAKAIMERYTDPEENIIGINEVIITQEGTMTTMRADWVIMLEESLQKLYGESRGLDIANKLLTQLVIRDDTTH
ncbi:hypothetical protein L3V86_01055 [Thiotrichales bacterium 19S11-10]|nr:hypothetical protein [Thiotrichales bacterium 19S11-10]MCF6808207.1 hypothetical protein [Thiotrichales bacterium 19S9-11]MCF6812223.1 hypothetical protein [Thiotrichales bacterium 19S9-12]